MAKNTGKVREKWEPCIGRYLRHRITDVDHIEMFRGKTHIWWGQTWTVISCMVTSLGSLYSKSSHTQISHCTLASYHSYVRRTSVCDNLGGPCIGVGPHVDRCLRNALSAYDNFYCVFIVLKNTE